MAYIFDYLGTLARGGHDERWHRSEIDLRLSQIQRETDLAQRVIPIFVEDLSNRDIDDIMVRVWLMTANVDMDIRALLEIDALGTALDLVGCSTRLGMHVRDELQRGRSSKIQQVEEIRTLH